ncbi:MAG: CPXCG motif-containing cysteine-rich protein [Gemmatimonadota bacterium]
MTDEFTPEFEDYPSGSAHASCPYCGASVEVIVDPGGAAEQRYVEDCEVCCQPWNVTVRWNGPEVEVELRTEDATD